MIPFVALCAVPLVSSLSALSSPFMAPTSASSVDTLKMQALQLGAALDRGQSYNPTSGPYYSETMVRAKETLSAIASQARGGVTLDDLEGEWELVLSTVPHGIFRSSPFFLAVADAFTYAEEKEAFGQDKANLFFKLHELQTCSWGVSKVGRVAQRFDKSRGMVFSEFDTSIFSLTVIPILGWWKLLPTFGGCVVTASNVVGLSDDGKLDLVVDYTTSRPVEGLSGLGRWIWDIKVPVGAVWRLLPWNKGRDATCSLKMVYCDGDFRIAEDSDGEYFVYTRPVVPRPLDL